MARRGAKRAAASRWSGRAGLVAGAIIAATGIMIGAMAAIPDAGGVIHGCYAPSSGYKLRVIDTAKTSKCPSGQVALNWNQHGVPGSPGPSGSPGTAGQDGSTIAARLRTTNPVTLTSASIAPIPLDDSSWTQNAGEINELVASFDFSYPDFRNCSGSPEMDVVIKVDGYLAKHFFIAAPTDRGYRVSSAVVPLGVPLDVNQTHISTSTTSEYYIRAEVSVRGAFMLFEPAAPTTHSVAITISNGCGTYSGATADPVVNSAAIDVVRTG